MVRTFLEGDEFSISTIFENCYEKFSGYVPRTPQYWRWFNLSRPGVNAGDVLVATENDLVVGCMTVCPGGEICDPCYDPGGDGKKIMTALLKAAQALAISKDFPSITINAPKDDTCINSACRELQLRQRKPDRVLSASVINWHLFFPKLLEACSPPEGNFHVTIGGRREDELAFSVRGGKARMVDASSEEKPMVRIKVNEGTLVKAIFIEDIGFLDWIRGRISVSPLGRFYRAHRLINSLNLGLEIFLQRGGAF